MPECSPEKPRFRGWTCTDRNGRSNEQQAAVTAALMGASGRDWGVSATHEGVGAVVRSVVGDELADLGESALGVNGKQLFTLLLTLGGVLACLVLCVTYRACRAACASAQRKRRLARVARPRSRGGGRHKRLATDMEDGGEEDDEILGDGD